MNELAFFQSGSEEHPTLVLGHALGADHRIWDPVTHLLKDRFRVVRWDQPGHGDSEALPAGSDIGDVARAMVYGLDQLGIERFNIAGISLGGLVSLAVAEQYPDRALSLGVLNSGPSLRPSSAWVQRAAQVRESGMESLAKATMDRWFAPTEDSALTLQTFLACNPEGYARACEVIAAADLNEGLSELVLPTLVLTGEDDPGFTPDQAIQMALSIRLARVSVIPGSRHLTCLHNPELVARELARLAQA